jgi:predicted ferric reductase
VPTAAKPAATAASFATCFTVEALGRRDFIAFEGRLTFVVLLLFDLAPARFRLVFDWTRRFDEVFDLARFFAFFMIFLIRYGSAKRRSGRYL